MLLAEHDEESDGWYDTGAVAVCAWPREEWIEVLPWYYEQHADIFERLGVPCGKTPEWNRLCKNLSHNLCGP